MRAFGALLGDVRGIPVVVIDSPRSAQPLAADSRTPGCPARR
jgi:hypothetical protein